MGHTWVTFYIPNLVIIGGRRRKIVILEILALVFVSFFGGASTEAFHFKYY